MPLLVLANEPVDDRQIRGPFDHGHDQPCKCRPHDGLDIREAVSRIQRVNTNIKRRDLPVMQLLSDQGASLLLFGDRHRVFKIETDGVSTEGEDLLDLVRLISRSEQQRAQRFHERFDRDRSGRASSR